MYGIKVRYYLNSYDSIVIISTITITFSKNGNLPYNSYDSIVITSTITITFSKNGNPYPLRITPFYT
jgi:hypothetical protein